MKTIFKLTPILFLFFALSCSKDKSVRNDALSNSNWTLVETLVNIGAGNPKYEPAKQDSPARNLIFKEYGKVKWDSYDEFKTYSIKDSVTLTFVAADKSTFDYHYQIKDGVLTLTGKCFEGCGWKYVKME